MNLPSNLLSSHPSLYYLVGKRAFSDMIKIKTLRSVISWISGGPNVFTWVSKNGENFPSCGQRKIPLQKGQRNVLLLILKMEEGSHEARDANSLWKMEKASKQILPGDPRKEKSSAVTLTQGGLCWSSELENLNTINFCCFKSLNL